ncbi:MAG: 2-oxo acid dehydrogenase subunit E2 [Bacteroidales bacterium]|nr:2-oxo acid dehydrogenase subunit E2 [Bacteroidales bacterium]
MAVVIIMPKQGQSVESCIITDIKPKGSTIAKGDILFTYETDKASFEETAPEDGVILESLYNEGDEVIVLEPMMVIGQPGEDVSGLLSGQASAAPAPEAAPAKADVASAPQTTPAAAPQATAVPVAQTPTTGFQAVSPRAKQLATKEVVDTASLQGSGPNGRVIERDVQAVLANRPAMTPLAKQKAAAEGLQVPASGTGLAGAITAADLTPAAAFTYSNEYEDKKLSNMRKLIAKAMHQSLQNSAQLTHHLGADARNLMALRKRAKKAFEDGRVSTNITVNDLVCFAVIKALKQYPSVNAHFLGESMRIFKKVHLGLAVDTDRGLMVPVVRNADDLSLAGLASQLKEVAVACRKGGIAPELLSSEAASFTVSNLGNYGVEIFTPVINLPQAAILGVNTIVPRPKDLGDGIYGFVPYLGLSLTYDHRALDGGEATRFLKQIAVEIETLETDLF